MMVKLKDGRVVEGVLECVDQQQNLILSSAYDKSGPHLLGLVLIPGKAHEAVFRWNDCIEPELAVDRLSINHTDGVRQRIKPDVAQARVGGAAISSTEAYLTIL